jgi:hypothetical protein
VEVRGKVGLKVGGGGQGGGEGEGEGGGEGRSPRLGEAETAPRAWLP